MGLTTLCGWFGISRQAYYKHNWRRSDLGIKTSLLLEQINKIRENHKKMGTRKLYEKLRPFMHDHQIKMGRDALFSLLSSHSMLVRRRQRRIQTTNSFHWLRKYPNLIKDFVPTSVNQLWVSDITYWKTAGGFLYISFITDAYSHKIVGYHVAQSLAAVETLRALKMALSGLVVEPKNHFQLIHHSDRGIQYCSSRYTNLLKKNKVRISMTENGDPLENAVAERLNGIMKQEYLKVYRVKNIKEAKGKLKLAVNLYNQDRPHNSIGNLVPDMVHDLNCSTNKLWKNYYKKSLLDVTPF